MSTFNDLNIEEQVNFINSELEKNKSISVTKLCKKFGFNKSTVVSRFTTNGFTYNPKQRKYVNDTKVIPVECKNIDIPKKMKEKSINENDLKEIIKYKDIIIKLAKEYQNNIDSVKKNNMIIDVALVGGKTVNHNFKVYENVKKEIQELQKQNEHFRLVDLVSTALHQYYLKHKI